MEYNLNKECREDRIAVIEEGLGVFGGEVPFATAICEKTFASGVAPPRPMDCRRELNALEPGEGDGGCAEPFLPLTIADLLECSVSDMFGSGEVGEICCLRFGVKERKNDQSDSNCTDSNSVASDAKSRRADWINACSLLSVPRRIKAA